MEEIPAGYLKDAVNYISSKFTEFLQSNRLTSEQTEVTYTPRRLTLVVKALQAVQEDLDTVKSGPNRKIAFKEDGTPAPALAGFLRSSNAELDEVFWQDNGKGEVACLRIKQAGRTTESLLPDWIKELIRTIPFPKKMRWGSGSLDFARPVRWLVCLWDREVIQLEVNGVKSGRKSYGNRWLGLDTSVEIASPEEYFSALKTVRVIAGRKERCETISRQLKDIFANLDYEVVQDEGLLQTVTDLVEYPTAVLAEFEQKFLVLPEKIITSTISTNQKYFAVKDKAGKLTNKFVFISNGDPECSDLIRKGNEKVVKPRLEDAMWYFHEDTRQKLETFVPHLEEVVFQAELGTLKAKTDRLIVLTEHLAGKLGWVSKDIETAKRTAFLCKADLVTKMLGEKEFTKLQGYIGMHYALASGESEAVARGIYEHYMPRGQNDELPASACGSVVAVADKLDTVCGIIGIGMLPTGSADPFALRRAANGIVQIIAENRWDLDVAELIRFTLDNFRREDIHSTKNLDTILNFFHQRINWYLQQMGIDYDVIDSVMHIDFSNLLHLIQRAKALQEFRQNDDFIRLVIGFKRVSNIIKDEKADLDIDEKLLQQPSELALHKALLQLQQDINADLVNLDYVQMLNHLVSVRPAIDQFFDDVLVNAEDKSLKNNRYALLQELRNAFLQVADISLLVVEGKA